MFTPREPHRAPSCVRLSSIAYARAYPTGRSIPRGMMEVKVVLSHPLSRTLSTGERGEGPMQVRSMAHRLLAPGEQRRYLGPEHGELLGRCFPTDVCTSGVR